MGLINLLLEFLAQAFDRGNAPNQTLEGCGQSRCRKHGQFKLPKGKGNKIISIPSARAGERLEYIVALCTLGPRDTVTVHAGRRHLSMKVADLEHYRGERGRRGNKLPRGFQNVDRVEVIEGA